MRANLMKAWLNRIIDKRAQEKLEELISIRDIGWSPVIKHKRLREADSDVGYTKVGAKNEAGLPIDQTEKMMEVSADLWYKNPMAKRIMSIYETHIVGDGITFTAAEEQVQEIIDAHWNDPANNWEMKQFERLNTFFLFGELQLRPFVNEKNGHVRLGYVDPLSIDEVQKDSDNAERIKKVKLYDSKEWLDVIGYSLDPFSDDYGRLTGDIFLFQINKLPTATRGVGELYALADWLDAFDQFIYGAMERINMLNAYLWDVTITGAAESEVERKADELRADPPRPGSVRVHNESVEWRAEAPRLNSGELETLTDIIRGIILGGAGLAFHWIGQPKTINRATAREAERPAYQFLKSRQRIYHHVLHTIISFCIDQAIKVGRLPEGLDTSFTIKMPKVDEATIPDFAEAFSQIVRGAAEGVESGMFTKKAARDLISVVTHQLGTDIDLEADAVDDFEGYKGLVETIFKNNND